MPTNADFKRALGPFDATMVVVGGIIGAGIFINPSLVAQRLALGGLVLAAWAVGGAIALAGAFSFAELGARFPRAGGQYVYLREANHPFAGFLFGWALLLMIERRPSPRSRSRSRNTPCALRAPGRCAALPLAIAALVVLSAINFLG